MGYFLDVMLVAIVILCIVSGTKKGFFKSLMSLLAGIVALLLAFTLTPALSLYIRENMVMGPMTDGIEKTFLSIAEAEDENGEIAYSLEILFKDSQFVGMMEDVGVTEEMLGKILERDDINVKGQIKNFATLVAEPLAQAVSDTAAFIVSFAVSLVVLRLLTILAGVLFKLPVLKTFDKGLGAVFGVLTGVLFAFVFAACAEAVITSISNSSPHTFSENIIENSFLIGNIVKLNPFGALLSLLS